jgi:hypothetical protein
MQLGIPSGAFLGFIAAANSIDAIGAFDVASVGITMFCSVS